MTLLIITLLVLLSPSVLILAAEIVSAAVAECANYDSNTNTIIITCNANLSEIDHFVNNRTVLEKDSQGVWILNASIRVNPLAKFTINHTDALWLKITNKNPREPNYISISGSAKIDDVKISSWDPIRNDTIRQNVNGSIPRPYLVANNAVGIVNISNSEVAFLGYNSFPSNGIVYERGGNGSTIVNSTFHDMWDGFYSHSVGFITIKNNKYYNNLRYGIDPHSGSHDLSVIGNLAYNNSKIGIICSENCYSLIFNDNIVHDNGLAGLMFSLQVNNSVAKKNYVYNEKVGISIFSSSNNTIYDNLLKSNYKGVFIAGTSSANRVYNNTIMNSRDGIEFANAPKDNILENNQMYNVSSSIHYRLTKLAR
jgi:mannuronan 5-epimerase